MKHYRKYNSLKAITFLVIVLTMALGFLGVGYGAWGQNLGINGKVNTGTWTSVSFDQAATSDPTAANGKDPQSFGTWDWTTGDLTISNWTKGTLDNKNYGTIDVTAGVGTNSLTVKITLAKQANRPYTPSLAVLIKNTGSVPIKIDALTFGNGTPATHTQGGIFTSGSTVKDQKSALGFINFTIPNSTTDQTFTFTVTVTAKLA